MVMNKIFNKEILIDIVCAIVAGIIVGTAYYFFQNSNGFASFEKVNEVFGNFKRNV